MVLPALHPPCAGISTRRPNARDPIAALLTRSWGALTAAARDSMREAMRLSRRARASGAP